jgi:hypothetical protein
MKSCRVQPHSMDGTMDCRGNTVGEHDSAHLSQPDSWQLATSLRGELASARTHHSITRYAVEETRSGTSANARACVVKRGYSAEGFERN